MKIIAAAFLLLPLTALAQHKQPTEAQCRQMNDSMVEMMKSAPMPEKDKQSAKPVIERTEKLIRDNRARGVSECETWGGITKIVTST
jgi:predicted  nucleic acid-binding Zn-ribbon protein